jgi:hypothetical protein
VKKKMTRAEKVGGWLSWKLLLWLADRASARGDRHEAMHCVLALMVGNSTHSEKTTRCLNPEVREVFYGEEGDK